MKPEAKRAPSWVKQVREGLQVVSRLIIASPIGLPAKVITVAKYVSLALGIWEAVGEQETAETPEDRMDDAP